MLTIQETANRGGEFRVGCGKTDTAFLTGEGLL
jgi:hypothetical protein